VKIGLISLEGVDQGGLVKFVIKNNNIYLGFNNIFWSSDFGDSWEEISQGLPQKMLTGNLHLFGYDILYHDVDQKNIYVFNKDQKRCSLKDSGYFSLIFHSLRAFISRPLP
jgi:hypothetical protein